MVPSLKVMKTINPGSARKFSSTNDVRSSVNSSIDFDRSEEPTGTTYKVDYKDRGVDVCMAKAYSMVATKMLQANN